MNSFLYFRNGRAAAFCVLAAAVFAGLPLTGRGQAPTVVPLSASNVASGSATLNASVTANGSTTAVWFQYGLTGTYGSTTITSAADNAESYSGWAYGENGGTGFGPADYVEGTGGGIFIANASDGNRQIDGNQSFGVYAGSGSGNTQGMDRAILNAQLSGTVALSARFDVSGTVNFCGFNLKATEGTTFGTNEIISVGVRPGNGNTAIAVNGGAQTIVLTGSSILGQIIDFNLAYDCVSGTYTLGAKLRASGSFTTTSGTLKITGQPAAYLGFGNFNTGNNQNFIADSITVTTTASAGSGTNPAAISVPVSGLAADTTYHYRVVAVNSSGTTFGPDQTFGVPLVPAGGATYHSTGTTTSSSGSIQARIYDATGHIAIAGPDLSGNPLANVITFEPPTVKVNGVSYAFGGIVSSSTIANGLQLVQSVANTNVTTQLTFPSNGVMCYQVTNWNGLSPSETDVTAGSGTGEHFFGLGEKFNSFDQAGNKVHMIPLDNPGDKGDAAYKPVPWFVSNLGYGFHLDSTAESYFDMRNSMPDRYIVQNLYPSLKFNVVYGPLLTDVVKNYTGYSGRPYLPPPWVFGTWVSSDIWRTGGEVKYAVLKYLANNIPVSAFVFDSPWSTSYNDYNWNLSGTNSQFGASGSYSAVTYSGTTYGPNYSGFTSVNDMMTFFQSHGIKVILWFTPFTDTSSLPDNADNPANSSQNIPGQNTGQASNYASGSSNNYFVLSSTGGPPLTETWWKGTGSPVDFTNPAAVTWFQGQLQALVTQSNVTRADSTTEPVIGGFKTDDGEALNPGSNTYIPTTAVYSDGRTGILMRNGYCIEYHKAVSAVLGTNGIIYARSGFAGTQQYPGGWPGDNEPNYTQTNGFQSVITASQGAAMCGYAIWGTDIGAYQNSNFTTDPSDLFMRWAQFGAFTPIMAMHRSVDPSNEQQYPWGYSATALANYVTYAQLHSQLFPYIYSYAKEASTDGLPIIRPLVLMNQSDPGTYAIQHSFYFGNELMVAPMNAQDSTTRGVYLPAGTVWYDYWTNAQYTGGQTINWSNSDTTKMPLFVKQGAIVPMLINVPQTLNTANYVNNPAITTMDSGLQFLVYPGPSAASFNLYDGTTIQCSVNGTVTTLPFTSAARNIVMKIFTSAPAGVERNGVRMPALATQAAFNTATLGWFYDPNAGFLYVKFAHGGGNATIAFGPSTANDGITDSWRQYYFGSATVVPGLSDAASDPDGDGMTNLQEYLAGTSPLNWNDRLAVRNVVFQQVAGVNTFVVSWQSQPGIVYQIQWTNDMATAFQSVTQTITGDGTVMSWTDDGTQTGTVPNNSPTHRRFYRVTVPQ